MRSLATIRDVAKLAGVSVATVSRVLNKKGYVNQETALHVMKAIETLQYEPNAVARGLAGKKTGTIALILPDISNPFFPALARAVEDVAQEHGYMVILGNSDDQGAKEKSYIQMLKQKYIDGIIFASNTLRAEDVQQMRKDEIPLVLLDRGLANETACVIRAKNLEGAQMAVHHLLDSGCTKIAHLYGPQELITARERLLGYEEVVQDFAWYSPSLMVPGAFTIDGGWRATEALFARHPDVDGIFAGNDLMAVGALKALHHMGIKVPYQVAICGFDGIGLTEITEPELTTVAQPIYELGAMAARILIEEIQTGISKNVKYELDVAVIQRKSTRKGMLL